MGTPSPRGRLPGWYHDPDDPERLRYWSGSGWTARRRWRPTWETSSAEWVVAEPVLGQAVAHAQPGGHDEPPDGYPGPVLEGPVRPAELPAIAAAVGSSTERPLSPQGPASPRPGGRPPTVAGRPGLGTGPYSSHPRPWRASRRPVRVFGTVAVVAVIAMIITVGIIPPSARSEWALGDRSFVGRANNICSAALPGARRTSPPSMTAAPAAAGASSGAPAPPASRPPADAATQPTDLMATATAVDSLADRLWKMPVDPADRVHVHLWLDSWHSWAYDQRKVARDLLSRTSSATSDAGQAETMARAEQDAADHFAELNGLLACTLSSTAVGASPPVSAG